MSGALMNAWWKCCDVPPVADLVPTDRLILIALCDRTDVRTGTAWPSVKSLAAFAGVDQRTVRRSLVRLDKAGLVKSDAVRERPDEKKLNRGGGVGPDGKPRTTKYHVTLPGHNSARDTPGHNSARGAPDISGGTPGHLGGLPPDTIAPPKQQMNEKENGPTAPPAFADGRATADAHNNRVRAWLDANPAEAARLRAEANATTTPARVDEKVLALAAERMNNNGSYRGGRRCVIGLRGHRRIP
jgi:hypothetical protein